MPSSNTRGFGLLELLLVIAVIAVLAAIALPHYADAKARSLDAKLEATVRHVATGEEAYYAARLSYTKSLDDLDGIIVVGGARITIDRGNSGSIGTSFRVRGTAPGVDHAYVWVSDPPAGEPNLFVD
jgi:prepilin-type N-terminal cleavage/methylation domain-containing protein